MHSSGATVWRILSDDEATDLMNRVDLVYMSPNTETLPGQVGTPRAGAAFEANFGLFAYGETDDCCETPESMSGAWLSIDGRTWEPITLPPDTNFGGAHGAVGDIIFKSSDWHGPDGGFRPMVLWVGRFES